MQSEYQVVIEAFCEDESVTTEEAFVLAKYRRNSYLVA
jgi:hypothetical protein